MVLFIGTQTKDKAIGEILMADIIAGLIVVAMLALMVGGFLWGVNDCLNTVIYQKQKKKNVQVIGKHIIKSLS